MVSFLGGWGHIWNTEDVGAWLGAGYMHVFDLGKFIVLYTYGLYTLF